MTAVDKHSQLYICRTPYLKDSFDGSAHRTSGVNHIVDDNNTFPCYLAGIFVSDALGILFARKIVAVKGNINISDGDIDSLKFFMFLLSSLQADSTAFYAK